MRVYFHGKRGRPFLAIVIAILLTIASAPLVSAMPSLNTGCQELVVDGGFELGSGWIINPSMVPAGRVQDVVHSGSHAMRLGIAAGGNANTYSSIQQQVHLPATAASITLAFQVYTVSSAVSGDEQMLALIDATSGDTIAVPWRTLGSSEAWSQEIIDLTAYRGLSVLIYFNVKNDGLDGTTAMYLDEVSILDCPPPAGTPTITASPTPTVTPTASATSVPPATQTPTTTPLPTGTPTSTPLPTSTPTSTAVPPTATRTPTLPPSPCQLQCLPNGDFERDANWVFGATPLLPAYVNGAGVGGSRAVRLGNDGGSNVAAYSSIRQMVTIPDWPQSLLLRFWYWPASEGPDASDRQELLLLVPQEGQVVAKLWKETRDDRRWLQQVVDLTPFRGRTVDLYFNVLNDGKAGRTSMILDDICLELCGAVYPTARPTSAPTYVWPTSTPTLSWPTATPTFIWLTATPTFVWPTSTTTKVAPTDSQATATATQAILPLATATATPRSVPSPETPAKPSGPFSGWSLLEWLLLVVASVLLIAAVIALALVISRFRRPTHHAD